MGTYGWFINIGALLFMTFLAVFLCFPVYLPATKLNMSMLIPSHGTLANIKNRLCISCDVWLLKFESYILVCIWEKILQRSINGGACSEDGNE